MVGFDMCPDSSLGPNNISTFFFQHCWYIMKTDVYNACVSFFEGQPIPNFLLKNFICIVPKMEHPTILSQFWPISLCNVTYKILLNLISSRLSSFSHGSLSLSKGPLLKIDLSQRTLPWHKNRYRTLIRKYMGVTWWSNLTLWKLSTDWLGLLETCSSQIWFCWCLGGSYYVVCIKLRVFSVVSRGSRVSFFSSHGLRQVDPLSLFLFILVTEVLSRGLAREFGRGISHIFIPLEYVL